MIDKDGFERPDDPHAHMMHNPITPIDKDIDENYNFVNKNIFFRFFSFILRCIAVFFMGPWIKHRYKLEIIGKENIKLVKRKGVIVTVNHVHNFDNLLVGTRILNKRKCYFITLKDNINMPIVGFFLRSLGGIPIPSNLKAMPSFERSINQLLNKKKAIIICPEASLWPYYRGVRPFKKGAFRFAVNNSTPVLPVVISFRRKLRKKHAKKGKEKYKYFFTVHIGKPLEADTTLEKRKQAVELTNRTYIFYKETMDKFYMEEEKVEQEYKDFLIRSNKKIAKHFQTQRDKNIIDDIKKA